MRTVLVTVSPLLASLVIEILRPCLSLEIVADLPAREDPIEQLRALAPELVLLGLTGTETDELALPLLTALPSTLFLVLAPNGQRAWVHQMRPHRTALNELSIAALRETLAKRFPLAPSEG